MANLSSNGRADLQIPDNQPHGLQILSPEGKLDFESTTPTSSSMAPQGENRMSIPASTTSPSSMESVLDTASNLLAPQADNITSLPVSIRIPPSRSEVPQNTPWTVETGTEDLPTTKAAQHVNPNSPIVILAPSSSSVSTNVPLHTSRRADTLILLMH